MTDEADFLGVAQALSARESLDIAALELLYKLERSGGRFYDLLADRVDNDDAAALLRRSGREEEGHARRVQRAIAIKLGRDYEPSADLQESYPIDLPVTLDVAAILPGVIEGERAGDADYQRWAASESDPEVARLLRLNGREETLHSQRINEVIALLGGI
jgi:rubrerythrin